MYFSLRIFFLLYCVGNFFSAPLTEGSWFRHWVLIYLEKLSGVKAYFLDV